MPNLAPAVAPAQLPTDLTAARWVFSPKKPLPSLYAPSIQFAVVDIAVPTPPIFLATLPRCFN